MSAAACELCEAVPFTTRYHEDEHCWIAECESCSVPMVVWRPHGVEVPDDVLAHLMGELTRVANDVFGTTPWFLDRVMRQIPDHFHAHARPDRWATRA